MPRSVVMAGWGGLASLLSRRARPGMLFLMLALALALAAPVLDTPVPPLADYANHLARMHILAHLGDDPALADAYRIQWAVIPNLIMDAIVPALGRWIGVVPAGQIFTLATLVTLVTGPMAVHRAQHGRHSLIPLAGLPFAYNGMLLVGLMNYLLGTGLAVWGLALWIWLRPRPAPLRLGVAALVVGALFLCHLFAVGLFGMAVLSVEFWRWLQSTPRRGSDLLRALAQMAVPFLPVPALMAASPTMGLSHDILWEARGKLDGIHSIFQLYGDIPDLAFAAFVLSGGVWMARRGLLRLHPAGWAVLVLGGLVFLAMPRVLFGSWLADQRMPIAILFLVIGFLRPIDPPPALRAALLAGLVALVGMRQMDLQWHWLELEDAIDDLRHSALLIDRGASVLVAHADQPEGNASFHQALSHAPCLAVIDRGALVSTIFSVRGKQILEIAPAVRDRVDAEDGDPPTVSQMLLAAERPSGRYWDRWPDKYGYVFVLYTRPGDENPAPERLDLLHDGTGFQLYAVRSGTGHPTP